MTGRRFRPRIERGSDDFRYTRAQNTLQALGLLRDPSATNIKTTSTGAAFDNARPSTRTVGIELFECRSAGAPT